MRRFSTVMLLFTAALAADTLPPALFDGLRWRMIGPFRAGRAIAASGVPGDPNTFYFGAVGGGVWKTTDGGIVWNPIFDDQPVASIGAIAVAPSNPNIIYVGTGEADIRSSLSSGNGIYKSTDAGKTWRNVGLRDSKQIAKIIIHPGNPNIIFAAVLGHAYGPNQDRGIFRSSDGGQSWQKVLYQGPDLGAVDIALVPETPQILYATFWQARRSTWSQYAPLETSSGGLFKSTDGGDHWSQVTGHGLPDGGWKRSGVAVAPGTNGHRVYVLIDSEKGSGLFRSDDSGQTWTLTCSDLRIDSRSWYFSSVTVDPSDSATVYLPNVGIYRSVDAGKTFTVLKGAPGGDDYHYIWVDPTNGSRMIQASDQGVSISVDRGLTWSSWYNQPTAQLYHVSTDNQFPYNVYASQQDSGTVVLPSRTNHGEITEADRTGVGGAESGYIFPDPSDPNIAYVSNTYGALTRFDKRVGQSQTITPWPAPAFGADISERKYRFPWTSAMAVSPVDHALYYGAQYVLKTLDGGLTWSEISPDLTNSKNGVVYSIAPSPSSAAEIWAGTDTGLLQLTRDGGKSWQNITPPGLTEWSKITAIEVSRFKPGTAFAAVDRHRLDDYKPHLFRTSDYGKSWTPITGGIEEPSFLNCIREDPVRPGLLYACTETGVYVSFDNGDDWQSLKLNMPTVSVRDLVAQASDLVIATFGRSFWILDDIAALRQANQKIADSDGFLYQPSTAIRLHSDSFPGTPFPQEISRAKNPPEGAILDYYLKAASSEIKLEILDSKGNLVRRYSAKDRPQPTRRSQSIADVWITPPQRLTAQAGFNRFIWDLRCEVDVEGAAEDDDGSTVRGPLVLPGTYQVRLTAAAKQYVQPLKVELDPRSAATPSDLAKQYDLGVKIATEIAKNGQLLRQVSSLKQQLADLKKSNPSASLLSLISDIETEQKKISGVEANWLSPANPTGLGAVQSNLGAVSFVVDSADRTPPAPAYQLYDDVHRDLTARIAEWQLLTKGKLAQLNAELRAKNLKEIDLKAGTP